MLVKLLHHLFPTYGWIFSFPQEAGSRTASLKRSNQVRGLRHSRSVSCSVNWDPSTSPSRHCHQLTWTFISFFLFILPQFKNYFPIHGMNQAADTFIMAATFSGVSILNLSSETLKWRSCSMKADVLNMDVDKGMLSVWISHPSHHVNHVSCTFNAIFKNIKSFRKMTT